MDREDRIRLRPMERDDLERVLRWRNDPEVTEFLSDVSTSPLDLQEWYDYSTGAASMRLYAVEAEDGQFIGYVGLQDIDWDRRVASLYIVLGEKSYWDKGYGREAVLRMERLSFEDLDLERLDLTVLPFNRRAIACYERCGFRRVGFVQEWFFRRGRAWRPVHMRLIREQYQVMKKTWQSA